MNKRRFGKTGLKFPEMGMGCWAIGGVGYGPVSEAAAEQSLEEAWSRGVRFFDTADTYGEGRSEKILGEFLSRKQSDGAFIATKAGWDFYHAGHKKNFDPEYLRFACEKSLERLRVEQIDLYQLHNPKLEVFQRDGFLDVLFDLRREGKIRFLGLSLHTTAEAMWALENLPIDSIQIIYNILDQRMRFEVFPEASRKGVAVIVREPLACGILTGKYSDQHEFPKDDHRRRYSSEKMNTDRLKLEKVIEILGVKNLTVAALEFVLAEQAVSCVIPGAKTPEQIQINLRAASRELLSASDIASLQSLFSTDPLFQRHLLPA